MPCCQWDSWDRPKIIWGEFGASPKNSPGIIGLYQRNLGLSQNSQSIDRARFSVYSVWDELSFAYGDSLVAGTGAILQAT
jgi:hypothetical protein